ncbi:hypothetical protein BD779DRAFT_106723 [Infundibulicybe gibba]|nr:hypothetical protein BD779DRAFT_106723 [Infundibulicybe gibba]
MFQQLPPKSIELLLGIAPGKLFRSPAMQALFGVGILQRGDKQFKLSAWLLPLLRSGTVKLQHDAPSNYDINVCISNAHEHLAIACAEYMLSYPGLIGQDVLDVLDEQDSEDEDEDERDPFDRDIPKRDGWTRAAEPYAMKFWTMHLRNTKHSERLFEILRRVVCSRDDVEPVIEWLEARTDTPDDVLFRWHAARLKYNTQTDGFVSVTPVFLPSSEKVHWSDKEELF